jgi:transposase-like protein
VVELSRELRQVLVRHLVDAGKNSTEIASELGVSRHTARRDMEAVSTTTDAPAVPDEALGKRLVSAATIEMTDAMGAHLAVFEKAGQSPQEAVEFALATIALAYRGAWKFDLYPPGMAPRVRVVQLWPYPADDSRKTIEKA